MKNQPKSGKKEALEFNRQDALSAAGTGVFVIFAYISLAHTNELLSTQLGKSLLFSMALLWLLRSAMQVVFYKLKHWSSVAFL
ncbi:MAG: hypothetical protein ABFR65_08125 [Pseudomonadota bacterium]